MTSSAIKAKALEIGFDLYGVALRAGDGVAVSDEPALSLKGNGAGAELLLFDLA